LGRELLLYPPPGPWRIVVPDDVDLSAPSHGGNGTGLLSMEKTAETLGLGLTTVKDLVTEGTLASVKLGRRRLVPASAVQELITRLQQEQAIEDST
jgi:excisionase family DNA binding protein